MALQFFQFSRHKNTAKAWALTIFIISSGCNTDLPFILFLYKGTLVMHWILWNRIWIESKILQEAFHLLSINKLASCHTECKLLWQFSCRYSLADLRIEHEFLRVNGSDRVLTASLTQKHFEPMCFHPFYSKRHSIIRQINTLVVIFALFLNKS